MMDVLSDGLPHAPEELHACLADELGERNTINVHLCGLRKILNSRGEDIIFERGTLYGQWYRWVRLLGNSYNGKR